MDKEQLKRRNIEQLEESTDKLKNITKWTMKSLYYLLKINQENIKL